MILTENPCDKETNDVSYSPGLEIPHVQQGWQAIDS